MSGCGPLMCTHSAHRPSPGCLLLCQSLPCWPLAVPGQGLHGLLQVVPSASHSAWLMKWPSGALLLLWTERACLPEIHMLISSAMFFEDEAFGN